MTIDDVRRIRAEAVRTSAVRLVAICDYALESNLEIDYSWDYRGDAVRELEAIVRKGEP